MNTTTETSYSTLTVEVELLNDAERRFVNNVQKLLKTTPTADCRRWAKIVRVFAANQKLDMVIGTGGSHIWIHRRSEFFDGQNTSPANIRFAIITDN